MYITKKKSRIGVLEKPCTVCGEGLGQEPDMKAISKEYGGGHTKEAEMVAKLAISVALMFIPIVGWAAALVLNTPVVGSAIWKFGMKNDPILKAFIGMFKKATHMESCMKWWTDSNIRSMISGAVPYPISAEIKYEYKLQHAQEMVVNESGRWNTIANIFVGLVRRQPDLMTAQCATMPQGIAETHTTISPALVASAFSQLKEYARQKEYMDLVGNLAITAGQKAMAVQETRQTGLITGPGAFQLPVGVKAISGGALVLTPGVSSNRVIEVFPGSNRAVSSPVITPGIRKG